MKKFMLAFTLLGIVTLLLVRYISIYSFSSTSHLQFLEKPESRQFKKLKQLSISLLSYARQHKLNTDFCYIADMGIASGSNRFFVYDFNKDSISNAGLVAHGSCNKRFLVSAAFSNEVNCGCSAYGKYKVGYKYNRRFGNAYKLYGLDSSNSNSFDRNIVLHSYYLVPDKEVYPMPICNSLGCIMVSDNFLKVLSKQIDASKEPILILVSR